MSNQNTKLDPDVKKTWTDALRSGVYEQGCGKLKRDNNTYCCLGVAIECGLTEPKTGFAEVSETFVSESFLPQSIQNELARMNDGTLGHTDNMGIKTSAVEPKSFDEIADWIEANL